MAFTRVEKPHLFIAGLPALPYPCVKRSFFFHRNVPLTYPKGVVDPDPLRLSFSFPYDKNRLSMTIPAGVSAMLASHGSINGLILSHFLWTDNLRIRIRTDACSHTCPYGFKRIGGQGNGIPPVFPAATGSEPLTPPPHRKNRPRGTVCPSPSCVS